MWANKRRDTISWGTEDGIIIKWANESPQSHTRHTSHSEAAPFPIQFDIRSFSIDHGSRNAPILWLIEHTINRELCIDFHCTKNSSTTGSGRATNSTSAVIFASLLQSSAMRHERCVRFECYTSSFFPFDRHKMTLIWQGHAHLFLLPKKIQNDCWTSSSFFSHHISSYSSRLVRKF